MKLAYITAFLSFSGLASVTIPSHQNQPSYVIRTFPSNSNAEMLSSSTFDGCHVHFKDSLFPHLTDDDYFKKQYPISTWICLFSGEVFEAGYNTQNTNNKGVDVSGADNKIVYNYENKTWESVPDELYQSNGEINHLDLTIIKGGGFSGYVVVNRLSNTGEGVYFCLVRKSKALCGSGKIDKNEDISQASQDALKLLRSISFDDN